MGQEQNQREIWKYFELNRNRNTTYQNLWDASKVVLRGKFIALYASIRKEERSQINDLCLQLRKQREWIKPKVIRRQEK